MDGRMFDGLARLFTFLFVFGAIGLIATGYFIVKMIVWICRHVHIS